MKGCVNLNLTLRSESLDITQFLGDPQGPKGNNSTRASFLGFRDQLQIEIDPI